jgi:hypothetical protein
VKLRNGQLSSVLGRLAMAANPASPAETVLDSPDDNEQPPKKRKTGQQESASEGPVSDWERQQWKRMNILANLKSKPAYQAFNNARPRESRNRFLEPMTPDPCEVQSKRRWEKKFHAFKSRVNEWYGETFGVPFVHPQQEEQTGAASSKAGPDVFRCDDPRHYALSVCCPHAGLHCSCQGAAYSSGRITSNQTPPPGAALGRNNVSVPSLTLNPKPKTQNPKP